MKRREELEKIREMSDEDLRDEVMRRKESLFRLKFKAALGEVDAVKNIRRERRSLARLNTIIRGRAEDASSESARG